MIKDIAVAGWTQFLTLKYWREITIGTALIVVFGGGYVGYQFFISSREQRAYKAFSESHDLYEQALASDFSPEQKSKGLWEEVELAFNTGYRQNASSKLAPFFLAFQAEALARQGKQSDALNVMNTLLSQLHTTSPFYGLYAAKRALMKLDMPTDAAKSEGINELKALAEDGFNQSRDAAMYYLGEYYWSQNNQAQALSYFKNIKDLGTQGKNPTPSPWLEIVQDRLETVA